jgi:hypothetical protein
MAVQRGAEENLYLDFKQKSDAKKGVPGDDDKANLAKAISAFANTDGGLVIWGVKAKPASKDDPDVATDLAPISGLKMFLSRINALCGEVVSPPVAGVESRVVPLPGHSDQGFVITVVPKKRDALVQASAKGCRGFFIRTGSGSHQLPSSLIAEFYSRRPSPLLRFRLDTQTPTERETVTSAEYRKPAHLHDKVGLPWGRCEYDQHLVLPWCAVLRNEGLATARDVSFRATCAPFPGVTWAVAQVKVGGSGRPTSPGGPLHAPFHVPTFRTVDGPTGVGRLLDDVHPGQEVIIAQGELILAAEAFPAGAPTLTVSGLAFSLDTPQTEIAAEIEKNRIVSLLQPPHDQLNPRIRILPEPPSWLDLDE